MRVIECGSTSLARAHVREISGAGALAPLSGHKLDVLFIQSLAGMTHQRFNDRGVL